LQLLFRSARRFFQLEIGNWKLEICFGF